MNTLKEALAKIPGFVNITDNPTEQHLSFRKLFVGSTHDRAINVAVHGDMKMGASHMVITIMRGVPKDDDHPYGYEVIYTAMLDATRYPTPFVTFNKWVEENVQRPMFSKSDLPDPTR